MYEFFYIIFIKLYPIVCAVISPVNNKAALWVKGRKDIFKKIDTAMSNSSAKKIWMHCASLGEFEQGKPLLEKIKKQYPGHTIVLTFFSPSGYEVQKHSNVADHIFYLPIDSRQNAKKFLALVQPSLIMFVKYEYWYYYLKEAKEQNIPVLLASGIFFPHFSFFRWYGVLQRKMLHFITHFFLQTESSKELLSTLNITNVSVAGDTRFDRVLEVASEAGAFPEIEQFINSARTIVAGSTWSEDDEALDHFANTHPELKFIIAPHDISNERLKECCTLYKHAILYSEYKAALEKGEALAPGINALIIDNIGKLKFLYRYATICYVGGGFGSGIHNILEAAVYYKPVIFGPAYDDYSEAIDLIDKDGAFDIEDALELESQLNELLNDQVLYNEACNTAGKYVKNNTGATNVIMDYIYENRLLTN